MVLQISLIVNLRLIRVFKADEITSVLANLFGAKQNIAGWLTQNTILSSMKSFWPSISFIFAKFLKLSEIALVLRPSLYFHFYYKTCIVLQHLRTEMKTLGKTCTLPKFHGEESLWQRTTLIPAKSGRILMPRQADHPGLIKTILQVVLGIFND